MKNLLIHMAVIATVLIGGDQTLNHGRDTGRIVSKMNPSSVYLEAKRQAYHFNASFNRTMVAR